MQKVYIVAAKRTAIGKFGGSLREMPAVTMGEKVVANLFSGIDQSPTIADTLIFGNVLSAGLGQNVARQIALNSGMKEASTAYTVNMVCGSGMKAVDLGVKEIMLGDADTVVVGGTENMSRAPYVLPNMRFGHTMNDDKVIDTMMSDGLQDAFSHAPMGLTAENIAEKYHIPRERQDAFAYRSQQKAMTAVQSEAFKEEIVPLTIPQRKGEPQTFATDEFPRFDTSLEKLSKLKPTFKSGGTVTAGNASGINDGAAGLILMSEAKVKEYYLTPLAEIKAIGTGGVAPELMGTGPIPATEHALAKAQLTMADIDTVELNEAFASQAIAVQDTLAIPDAKLNPRGGAIALGHPIGASGARVLVSLVHELKQLHKRYGLATLCIGGGQGIATIIENV
ncbi:MAG: acetyl-CoA C-acetyltransferase [Aerococcus sp.]|nr:acetyl-CoA C-acetyltransferase [Aerococcus sp.]